MDQSIPVDAGIRRVAPRGVWFSHGPYGRDSAAFWPVTPVEIEQEARLGQATIPVFNWPGGGSPTALVLGPSSWGFGVGPFGGTAWLRPVRLPSTVRQVF
jgi:hypothetical protein